MKKSSEASRLKFVIQNAPEGCLVYVAKESARHFTAPPRDGRTYVVEDINRKGVHHWTCSDGSYERLEKHGYPNKVPGLRLTFHEKNVKGKRSKKNASRVASDFGTGLAQSGLPRTELDLLTVADVLLRGVTVTYLIRCATPDEAIKLVEAIRVTGKVLNPKYDANDSTNVTVVLPYSTFTVKAYIKTNLKHCKFEDGSPKDALIDEALCIVRIEVMVGERFLKKHGLLTLESWRDAYKKGVYQMIFDLTIRKRLRLGQLRHKAPREEVFARLTPTESLLLRDYLEGGDPRQFSSVLESVSPAKRFSALRLGILRAAKVDIDIPWVEHVKLRCFELDDLLHYPGDHEPSESRSPWCFCKSNWSNLLRGFKAQYEAALAAAGQKQALSIAPIDSTDSEAP